MFLPINCKSLNNRSQLSGMQLEGFCSYYKSPDDSANIMLCEYFRSGTTQLLACDLVVYVSDGDIYLHDYLLMEDHNWRDAFGKVSVSLASLFPDIVLTAQLLKREPIELFLVE